MSLAIYIICMALVTYLLRMIPFTLVKGKIKSQFVRSFLYYIPYAVLSAMTFPAILYSTGNMATAICGTVVALVLAFFKCPLLLVSVAAALTAFLTGFIF